MTVFNRKFSCALLSCALLVSFCSFADGGISIRGTRVIFPEESKQQNISVNNSSTTDNYLVQSWIEDASGHKTHDLIITPPLYLSKPKTENMLRIMRTGGDLPHDRETLYYLTVKAIPSIDKPQDADKLVLHIAAASRIKLLVRPQGLTESVTDAPAKLTFTRNGHSVRICNPTPYFITMTNLRSGSRMLPDIMVPPRAEASEPLPAGSADSIRYQTINDYGAVTPDLTAHIK